MSNEGLKTHLLIRLATLAELRHELLSSLLILENWAYSTLSSVALNKLCSKVIASTNGLVDLQTYIDNDWIWQPVTLNDWLPSALQLTKSNLPESLLDIPKDLRELRIWENSDYTYWVSVLVHLAQWWRTGFAHLEAINWTTNSETIELVVIGQGEIKTIFPNELLLANHRFWLVTVPTDSAELNRLSATLLLAQLTILQGGGKLLVRELDGERFSIEVSIPQAHMMPPSISNGSTLSLTLTRQVLDNVLSMTVYALMAAGNELNSSLVEELKQPKDSNQRTGDESLEALDRWLNQFNQSLLAIRDWFDYQWTDQPITAIDVANYLYDLTRRSNHWTVECQDSCQIWGQPHKTNYILRGFIEGARILFGAQNAGGLKSKTTLIQKLMCVSTCQKCP